ncbi:MAG TPA: SRPBCC domain-containing protein [Puia sp.]|nr:SRPBCC domain-containing protein [Puia sp.]
MQPKSYQKSIMVNVTPQEAYEGIKDVQGWWARKVEGRSRERWDVFTVRFGATFVTFEIMEDVPEKKIVWDVRDCNLHWIKDKKEWNGTRVVFEIEPAGEGTKVTMTHEGLAPGAECYEDCRLGWNEHFGESLVSFLTEQAGQPV